MPEQVSSAPASAPYVAQLANGGRIVAWSSSGNNDGDVFAQVFDAGGAKVGAAVTVFSGSTGGWSVSGVGALPDGSFLVAASGFSVVAGTLQTQLFVQKVSSTGQLLASGGTGDPGVNGGLADLLISEPESATIRFSDSTFFGNSDGSYVVQTTRETHPVPNPRFEPVLLSVASTGNVVGAPAEISNGYVGYPAPVATRLSGGNFLEAGMSTLTYGPVVWKVLTSTGQVLAQQSLGAAPGNGTSDPRVTALADGTGLLTWYYANSVTTGWRAERIDGSGNVVGSVVSLPRAGDVTGLAHGGWVQTWISGTQLLAQYFATSGQAVGDPFVVADNLVVNSILPTYSVAATSDGFVAAYSISTPSGPQVDDIGFTAPPLN